MARPKSAASDSKRAGTEATPLTRAHGGVEWLIDNAEAYERLLRAMQTAQRSIWMTQLAFDAGFAAYPRDDRRHPSLSLPSDGATLLAETLVARATSVPVDVRILLNATLLIDTSRALGRFFDERMAAAGKSPGRIRVRGVRRFPQLMHAKMVIIDGTEAFLLGSPFANGYWDDVRHLPVDARRPARELGGRPLHDVSMRIAGIAVRRLERIFLEYWRDGLTPLPKAPADGARWHPRPAASRQQLKSVPLQIVCTAPRGTLRRSSRGATDILDALLAGIERARSLIYIEHQYLSARPVVAALTSALRRQPDLELVIVLNQNPDVTAYRRWQNARLAEHGLLAHPRVGVFSIWSAAPCDQRAGVTPSTRSSCIARW